MLGDFPVLPLVTARAFYSATGKSVGDGMAARVTPNGIDGIVRQTQGLRPVVQVIGRNLQPVEVMQRPHHPFQ